MNRRLQFSDTIYENIVFDCRLPSKLNDLNPPNGFDPLQVIQTAEFARLSFLRRHGLAWIVYPAATQTRLEYAIGNWGLARLAELLIQIRTSNKRIESLAMWLKETKLREEYYLSLLCNDLGCAPLEAAFQVNKEFGGQLAAANLSNLKDRSAALVGGTGTWEHAWQQMAKDRYGSAPTLSRLLNGGAVRQEPVCISVVCFLLTGNKDYLQACSHIHKYYVGFLRDLIRGLFFLRRLDHCGRDSYISTIREFGKNLRGFLRNLILTPNSRLDGIGLTSINHSALEYTVGLLMKRKNYLSSKDRSADVIALHEMANWALQSHLAGLREAPLADVCQRIVFMEDDQVLELLSGSPITPCRIMLQRIRAAESYVLVGRWQKSEHIGRVNEMINTRSFGAQQPEDSLPEVLVRYIEGDESGETNNCFAIGNIRIDQETALLSTHPKYKNNVSYLDTLVRQGCLYVFAKDAGRAQALKAEIDIL